MFIDAFNYTQKDGSDGTNDAQLPMHVLVSCPDYIRLFARDSLVNQEDIQLGVPDHYRVDLGKRYLSVAFHLKHAHYSSNF